MVIETLKIVNGFVNIDSTHFFQRNTNTLLVRGNDNKVYKEVDKKHKKTFLLTNSSRLVE